MKRIFCDVQVIAQFVSGRIGQHAPWGHCTAIGLTLNDEIIAGVVYNHFSEVNLCMHVGAVEGSRWMTPEFLFAAFDYPFCKLGMHRVTGLVPRSNVRARKLNRHLGFRPEGCMRRALPNGDDLLVMGMLKGECRWISEAFCERLARRLERHSKPILVAAA
jgi:RimJ/RimL family protein N-acetyltransferase